jgi:hypothetical protein
LQIGPAKAKALEINISEGIQPLAKALPLHKKSQHFFKEIGKNRKNQ